MNGLYNPVRIFQYLYKLEGSAALSRLVKFVKQLDQTGLYFSLDDWVKFLIKSSREITIPLNSVEVKVADALLSNPFLTREKISQQIYTSADWVGRVLHRMLSRKQLVLFERLSFRAFNIHVIQLLIEPLKTDRYIAETYFKDFPFLYASRRILNGHGGLLVTLAVPNNPQNLRAVAALVKQIRDDYHIVQEFERERVGQFHSFTYYN